MLNPNLKSEIEKLEIIQPEEKAKENRLNQSIIVIR